MKSKGNTLIPLLVTLGIIGILATTGYLYLQNQKLQKVIDSGNRAYTASPTAGNDLNITAEPSPTGTQGGESNAVVVYEAAASFPISDKNEIEAKVVDPFLMYYTDLNGGDYIKSLTISINKEASKADYPYTAKYVFKDGVNGGFTIARKGSSVDWWYPECMGPCPYSEAFKTKYPEIVKLTS